MPGYKTEATESAFHLRNKSGIRNTEELEQDSAGCCGESWTDIWDRLFSFFKPHLQCWEVSGWAQNTFQVFESRPGKF